MAGLILVIDDEAVTRRVVIHALKALDLQTLGAANGEEAVQLASETHFSLAIVDINLPDTDGFALIGQLREIPHMKDIPYIIFTARNQPQDQSLALESKAVGFLYKPFSTQELRSLVSNHLPSA